MIDVFVTPDFAGQTVTVTGTDAAERFVLSTKFGSSYSVVIKAQGGGDLIPSFTLNGSANLTMGDGADKVTLETEAMIADLGSGDDQFTGNGQNECEVKGGSGDTVVIDGGTGADKITSAHAGFGFDLKGGPGNDELYANDHIDEDKADGGDGNDLLEMNIAGSTSPYTLTVLGGKGNDILRSKGDSSAQFAIELWGGAGLDKISCGAVIDRLHFKPTDTPAGTKRDIVYKFADGTDKIVPEGDANRNQSGVQDYQFVGQTKNPGAGKIGWYSTSGGPIIIGSDGRTVFEIKLDKFAGTLDPSDFVF
jgi:hypothetical protein